MPGIASERLWSLVSCYIPRRSRGSARSGQMEDGVATYTYIYIYKYLYIYIHIACLYRSVGPKYGN